MKIVGKQYGDHTCGLSDVRYGRWRTTYCGSDLEWLPVGTVIQCECGKTWVGGHIAGLMTTVWRKEGFFERLRRQSK